MAKSIETGMVVVRSRIFGEREDSSISVSDPRLNRSDATISIVTAPWIEVDFGTINELRNKFRHLGAHVCIADARINRHVLDLAKEAKKADQLLRVGMDEHGLVPGARQGGSRLNWSYDDQAQFWVPESPEETSPRTTSSLTLSRHAIFKGLHLMPIRHSNTNRFGEQVETPEVAVY